MTNIANELATKKTTTLQQLKRMRELDVPRVVVKAAQARLLAYRRGKLKCSQGEEAVFLKHV